MRLITRPDSRSRLYDLVPLVGDGLKVFRQPNGPFIAAVRDIDCLISAPDRNNKYRVSFGSEAPCVVDCYSPSAVAKLISIRKQFGLDFIVSSANLGARIGSNSMLNPFERASLVAKLSVIAAKHNELVYLHEVEGRIESPALSSVEAEVRSLVKGVAAVTFGSDYRNPSIVLSFPDGSSNHPEGGWAVMPNPEAVKALSVDFDALLDDFSSSDQLLRSA